MASAQSLATTDESKMVWHSWIVKSSKHNSKQDKPEREIIAFSTAFELDTEEITTEFDFMKWLLPIIILCSLTSNVIMIRIMYMLSQWKFPLCLYVAILSSLETLHTIVKLLDKWCQVTFSAKFLNSLVLTSHAVCSTYTIAFYTLIHMISMIRSALCIDLYYCYKNPMSSTSRIVISRIHHLLLLFITLLLIFNSHFLWTYSIIHMNNKQMDVPPGNYCTYLVKWVNPTFRDVIWPFVDFTINELCPILSILICSLLILITNSKHSLCYNQRSINDKHHLSRHLIDVNTFIEMRKVFITYNILTLVLILIPNSVSIIYKSTKYQLNHSMKIVTTFSIARYSNRSYKTPSDISVLEICIHILASIFSVSIVVVSLILSPHGFRKEFKSQFLITKKSSKINYQI